MTEIFLVVLFLVNGEPTMVGGYEPRIQPDASTCMTRKEHLDGYVNSLKLPFKFVSGCITLDKNEIQALIDELMTDDVPA